MSQSVSLSTSMKAELATGELKEVDLRSPFVTISVDSNRINTTFDAILSALQNVRVVVSNLCTVVDGNKSDIQTLQKGLNDLTSKWENDPRIADLQDRSEKQGKRLSTVEEALASLQGKMDKIDQRLAQQESKRVDFTPLENQIKAVKKEIGEVAHKTTELDQVAKEHNDRILTVKDDVTNLQGDLKNTATKVKALYTVFEMNEDTVLVLANDPSQKKPKESTPGRCGLTDYVVGLPSFQYVFNTLKANLADLEKSTSEAILVQKRKLAEEAASIRSKLGEKLDERAFLPVKGELEALVRRVNGMEPRIDKIADDVETKAAIVTTQKMFDHLDQVKADKSDLVGLLHRDDLLPIEKDIQQLAEAIDSSGAKIKLEMKEIRQKTPPPEVVRRSSLDDKLIGNRIAAVETDVKQLKEDKLGKEALADVYLYLDNSLAKLQGQVGRLPEPLAPIASSTPGITPSTDQDRPLSGGGKRRLAPLLRPPSAGKSRADAPSSPSIPEVVRSPSPPIQYTSSPAKYVPNIAKYRATASVFDSDGNRTLATVTAANVPMVDHWHNVARAAAGEEVIPEGMRRHTME